MQKGLNTKPRSAGATERVGQSGLVVLPGLSLEGGATVLPAGTFYRPASQPAARPRRPAARSDSGSVPAPPSPTSSLGEPPRRPRDPARPPAASPPGEPHRRSRRRFPARRIALGTRRPHWLLPLRPMAPAPAQFENGAEIRSRPTRRKRRGCPGNRSGPQWRRAPARPAGDGGSRASVPGNVTARPRRGHGAPWRKPRASATPGDLSTRCCARPDLRPSLGPRLCPRREGSFTGEFVLTAQYSPWTSLSLQLLLATTPPPE